MQSIYPKNKSIEFWCFEKKKKIYIYKTDFDQRFSTKKKKKILTKNKYTKPIKPLVDPSLTYSN